MRQQIVELGASLFARGFSVGNAGNISVRLPDGYLMTPTNSCLGRLDPARLSRLDLDFRHLDGDLPSKEIYVHRAYYQARSEAAAVVHLHSTYATAISCLPDPTIPPLTPYFVMRLGPQVQVVPYRRPGNPALEPDVAKAAATARGVLLANHGTVVSGHSLADAVASAEELEEAAKLALTLRHLDPRPLSPDQLRELV